VIGQLVAKQIQNLRGLLTNGSPIPGVKMLAYANAFWPAPDGPDLADGTAVSHTNPPSSTNEDFGLARFDYIISSECRACSVNQPR
jgi:hypothetical protein